MISKGDKVRFTSGKGKNLRTHIGVVEDEGTVNPSDVLSIRCETGLLYLIEAKLLSVVKRADAGGGNAS